MKIVCAQQVSYMLLPLALLIMQAYKLTREPLTSLEGCQVCTLTNSVLEVLCIITPSCHSFKPSNILDFYYAPAMSEDM